MAHDIFADLVEWLNENVPDVSWWEDTYSADSLPLGIVEEDLIDRIGMGDTATTSGVYKITITIITTIDTPEDEINQWIETMEQGLNEVLGNTYFDSSAWAVDNETGWKVHAREYYTELEIT